MTTEQFPARGEYAPGSLGYIKLELADARELLAAIRDDEVNAQDEADKFLRDNKFSALHAALEEIEQLKADNAVLRRQIRQMDDTGAPRGWSDVVEASINRAESAEAELAKLKAAWDSSFQQAMENWAKCRDLEAELAKLKAHAEAMAGEIRTAFWGGNPSTALASYRAAYQKED